jgi:hypothetical protein
MIDIPMWTLMIEPRSGICFHLGNAEYPRGFFGGNALKPQPFLPHFEHRNRLATSSSLASQPHSRPSVCGSAIRS